MNSIVADKGFRVESKQAETALKLATAVLEWCGKVENQQTLRPFAHILVVRLKACFASKHKTMQLKRERMWAAYHRLRTAETFVKDWRDFLATSVGFKAFPAFYQFVTHDIFKKLVKAQYPLTTCSND